MNKDQVVPQWCSDTSHAWFDMCPWEGREAVLSAAEKFKSLGSDIRLAGIWRVKEIK